MSEEKIVLLYGQKGDGPTVNVLYRDENLWLTQKQMAELFAVDRSVISKHLKMIFETEGLSQDVVCAKFAHMGQDGREYTPLIYSLDAIPEKANFSPFERGG